MYTKSLMGNNGMWPLLEVPKLHDEKSGFVSREVGSRSATKSVLSQEILLLYLQRLFRKPYKLTLHAKFAIDSTLTATTLES